MAITLAKNYFFIDAAGVGADAGAAAGAGAATADGAAGAAP